MYLHFKWVTVAVVLKIVKKGRTEAGRSVRKPLQDSRPEVKVT